MASRDSDNDIITCSLQLMTTVMNQNHKLNERAKKREIRKREWT